MEGMEPGLRRRVEAGRRLVRASPDPLRTYVHEIMGEDHREGSPTLAEFDGAVDPTDDD